MHHSPRSLALAVFTLASSATAAPTQAPDAESRIDPLVVRLAWFDPLRALPGGFEAASREVTRIFRGLGVDVSWRLGRPGEEREIVSPDEVPVILLREDPSGRAAGPGVLGLVRRRQAPPRGAWVFVSEVELLLCPPSLRGELDGARQRRLLPLAVARVVAHEVVHAIVPEEPHSGDGLMQSTLDRASLVGQRAPVDARCARALLNELVASRTEPSADGPTLVAAGP